MFLALFLIIFLMKQSHIMIEILRGLRDLLKLILEKNEMHKKEC